MTAEQRFEVYKDMFNTLWPYLKQKNMQIEEVKKYRRPAGETDERTAAFWEGIVADAGEFTDRWGQIGNDICSAIIGELERIYKEEPKQPQSDKKVPQEKLAALRNRLGR